MNWNKVLFGATGLVLLTMLGAVLAQEQEATVVARVGDTEITGVDIAIAAQLSLGEIQQMDAETRAQFLLQSVIDMTLMANAARDAGLDQDPLVRARLEFEAAQVLTEEYARKIANEAVTEGALRAAYEDYKASLGEEEERRFSHFMAPSRDIADAAIAEILGGASVAEVAADIPAEGTVNQNTDIGFIRQDALSPKLAEAGYALEAEGDVTQAIATEFGWQVLKLEEIRTVVPQSFEEMREELEQYVRESAVSSALRDDLPTRYPVSVLDARASPEDLIAE